MQREICLFNQAFKEVKIHFCMKTKLYKINEYNCGNGFKVENFGPNKRWKNNTSNAMIENQ